jgi:hypothetical protein
MKVIKNFEFWKKEHSSPVLRTAETDFHKAWLYLKVFPTDVELREERQLVLDCESSCKNC